jgi:hypothetical protein
MANRSYLYTLDKVPKAYDDRPGKISGLSEFAYAVPTLFYVLVSDDATLCPSLLFESDDFKVFALCGRSERGLQRAYRLTDALLRSPALAAREPLLDAVQAMHRFLDGRWLEFMYLEIAEIDTMTHSDGAGIRRAAEDHFRMAFKMGAFADQSTPENVAGALSPGGLLHGVFGADGLFDDMRGPAPPAQPLGAGFWNETLYFDPLSAAEWAANLPR